MTDSKPSAGSVDRRETHSLRSSGQRTGRTSSGLDRLLADAPVDLAGRRIGILANQSSVDRHLVPVWDGVAAKYPGQLRALYSPQHGLWAEQQANMIESADAWHPRLGVPVHSLYSDVRQPDPAMLADIDVLLIDLQDVGTRVYTFVWTARNCLRACAEADVDVVVLDRPNPIGGGHCEGAVLQGDFRSFVGDACIPMRHSLTMGEMLRYLNSVQQINASLEVTALSGWDEAPLFHKTGLAWIPPSPNLPTPASTLVYPGQVLLEGTNLSEGRGTTTPFEVAGAPFIDPFRLVERLRSRSLPGVHLRPLYFRPTFDKWSGVVCGGIGLHVEDASRFQPYRTTLELLAAVRAQSPDDFAWTFPPYEYEYERMPIDILSGDSRLRTWLDAQGDLTPDQIDALCTDGVTRWQAEIRPYRLYATVDSAAGSASVQQEGSAT